MTIKAGTKVKGLRAHKEKVGVIVEDTEGLHLYVKIRWDGSKRASWVSGNNLQLITD